MLQGMGMSSAALLLAACGSSASSSSSGTGSSTAAATGTGTTGAASAAGGSVTWTNVALPANLDPAIGFDSDTLMYVRNVYEGLLEYAPGSTELRPALAQSYKGSSDGLTYTFTLRKGLVFHDGSTCDAAAVVAGLNRLKAIDQGPASLLIGVKSFEAKGPSTVIIHMSTPYVFLPSVLPWLPIVSAEATKRHATTKDPPAEKWFAQNAAGTGPYMLESFSESKIALGQNKHYWQKWQAGTPTSGALTLNANVTTQLELLQNGQADFLGAISPDNAQAAQSLSNVHLITQPGLEVQTMPMNMLKAPMNDIRVRQAMVKAFDYDAFVKFNKGFGAAANSPVPKGLPGWDSSLPTPKQDLAGAKKLLQEAGVPSGTEIEYVGVQGLDYETFAGTILQATLQQLGLKVKTQSPAWPEPFTIAAKGAGGAHISFLNLSSNTGDPSAIVREAYAGDQIASKGGYNWSNLQDDAIDKALDAFSAEPSAAKRTKIITEIQQKVVAQAPSILAFSPQVTEPVAKKWKNVKYDALFDENVVRWFYAKPA
jgi:peptide/nickel transport system substrate-binding protein